MNRLVCKSIDDIAPDQLPPPRRDPGAPARVLFCHTSALGFGTTAGTLVEYAAARADVDAVHVTFALTLGERLLAKELPKWLRGWDFHNTRMTVAFSRPLERACRTRLPLDRFDVVHIMTRERAGIVRKPWARAAGMPRFVVNVDTTLRSWDRAFEVRRSAPPVDASTDRRTLCAADAVAFASSWAMRSGIADCGVDPARVILHKPCVRVTSGTPRPALPPGQIRKVVFVGNDWVRKGGPRLLRWHQQRWANLAELHVCSARAPIDRTRTNVVWHGAVPHDRLIRDILPEMSFCVIPTWEDTFLIAAQEAQAAGLPVVTSRLAGIPEVVSDGVTGLLADRHDDAGFVAAVERLLHDPALAAKMSAAAIAHVQAHLNPDIWHNHLLDQLVALADGRPIRTLPVSVSPPAP